MLQCKWTVCTINAKTAAEHRVTSLWESPDSVSDVDRVAVGAHKCHWSPKIQLQLLHCMKGCSDKHKQGKKNGCLSSNGGKIAHELDTVAWKKEYGGKKGKAGHRQNQNPHVSVSQAPIHVFFMSCSKGASSGTNAAKSSPCVCRMWCSGKCAWHPVSQAEPRLHPVLPGQKSQFCSSVTLPWSRCPQSPFCKRSWVISDLS